MKKILFVWLVLLSITGNVCVAINSPQPTLAPYSTNYSNVGSKNLYLKFYKIDHDMFDLKLNILSKEQEKALTELERKEYKKFKKIEKYLAQKKYYKAIKVDKTNLAIYCNLLQKAVQKNNLKQIVSMLEEIKLYDTYELFDIKELNKCLSEAYFQLHQNYADTKDYEAAIKYLKLAMALDYSKLLDVETCKYKLVMYYLQLDDCKNVIYYLEPMFTTKKDSESLNSSTLAYCYYRLNNYDKVIYYSKFIKNNSPYYSENLAYLFDAYINKNMQREALIIAEELYKYKLPDLYTASSRIAYLSTDNNKKLKFFNIAKKNTNDEKEIWKLNYHIAKLEQIKLDNLCKKVISGYFKTPNWVNISKQDINIMTIAQENERYNQYEQDVNNCTTKYVGNNLKACLNEVSNTQEKITQRLILENQERNRQIAEQQKLFEIQQMNYNLQVQNQLQRQQNYLIQQQNYELSRPRYYNSTTTQSGNYYYTNTYSY
ncbi:hypothetical protein J6A64_04320 [bacterium]|nr:hypothetical protein [bacterium]